MELRPDAKEPDIPGWLLQSERTEKPDWQRGMSMVSLRDMGLGSSRESL